MSTAATGRLFVVSPHLDDAVFSVGQLLAARRGAVVATVFAGAPADAANVVTDWDRSCGFSNAEQAMRVRRAEDRAALEPLSARPLWLDFLDAQYVDPGRLADDDATIAARLDAALQDSDADTVLLPLGLFHHDHERTHAACLHWLLQVRPPVRHWIAYEDALYRRRPGLLQQRLATLATQGIAATPWFSELGSPALKAGAVQAYASQLRAFGEQPPDDLSAAERYWQLDAGRYA